MTKTESGRVRPEPADLVRRVLDAVASPPSRATDIRAKLGFRGIRLLSTHFGSIAELRRAMVARMGQASED